MLRGRALPSAAALPLPEPQRARTHCAVELRARRVLRHRISHVEQEIINVGDLNAGGRVWRQLLFPVTTIKTAAHYTAAGSATARVLDFAPAALAR